MAVVTFTAPTSDNDVACASTTYSSARNGTGTLSAGTVAASSYQLGQELQASTYRARQVFLLFDVSSLASALSIDSVDLQMYLFADQSTTDFVAEAREHTWSPSVDTSDFVAGTSLSGLTLLGSLDTNGIGSTGSYKSFSENGTTFRSRVAAAAAGSGLLEVVLSSSRQRNGNTPSGNERVTFSSGNASSQEPKLVVTYTPGINLPAIAHHYRQMRA